MLKDVLTQKRNSVLASKDEKMFFRIMFIVYASSMLITAIPIVMDLISFEALRQQCFIQDSQLGNIMRWCDVIVPICVIICYDFYCVIKVVRFFDDDDEIYQFFYKQVKRLLIFPIILAISYLPVVVLNILQAFGVKVPEWYKYITYILFML